MPSLTVSSCLLALAALLVGFLGSQWLDRWEQDREEAEFTAVLDAVATLVAATSWQEPWESDPAWSRLEQQLNLDLVPVALTAENIWLAGSPSSTPLPVQRTRGASGTTRMTALVDLKAKPPAQPLGVRVTRELMRGNVGPLWWSAWGLLCLVGTGVVASAFAARHQQQRHLQSLLQPWLAALYGPPRLSQRLPKIDSDSELEAPLGIISELVNELVGELHGENQRSELVLGNLQEGVLAIDDRCHVLLANQALHQLLDIPPEPYLNRLLLELVRVPQVNEVAERVLKERTGCEVLVELSRPTRLLRVLGRPLPLDILPDEVASGGAISTSHIRWGALLTIRDETILRRIEAIRRDFVANASHELKTPLAAIRAYAETLQLGALDDRPTAEQFVGNIIEQADRINGLVQGMLQLSRVESGTALKFEWFNVLAAAQPCIAAARAVARGKAIEIETEIPPGPLQMRCDRDGFQAILSNLLANAVRYTHDGGHVKVSLAQAGTECLLRVSDTGIGISPQDLERIFERFYRAEKDRATHSGGTGLGLSIVKHLTQALGGVVQASSQPGAGSCFEVRLPIEGRQL